MFKSGVVIFLLAFLGMQNIAFAYKAFLDDTTIVPVASGGQRRLTIKNDEPNPIAIEVSMLTREILENGEEKNGPVPKEWFTVYPAQLIVEPGEEETVRVAWTNAVNLDRETAFRVSIKQIKINDNEGPEVDNDSVAKVDFLTNYLDALYVKPKGTAPKLVFNTPSVVTNGSKRMLRLNFENQGTARLWMPDLSLKIQALNPDGTIDDTQNTIEMQNVAFLTLLPFRNQIVEVPLPDTYTGSNFSVNYTYKKL